MSETKHTPEPWVACDRGDYADDGIVILGDSKRVAVVFADEDAPMIAAAPELLEVAKLLANQPDHSPEWFENPTARVRLRDAVISARIAIAKAEGKQP